MFDKAQAFLDKNKGVPLIKLVENPEMVHLICLFKEDPTNPNKLLVINTKEFHQKVFDIVIYLIKAESRLPELVPESFKENTFIFPTCSYFSFSGRK